MNNWKPIIKNPSSKTVGIIYFIRIPYVLIKKIASRLERSHFSYIGLIYFWISFNGYNLMPIFHKIYAYFSFLTHVF